MNVTLNNLKKKYESGFVLSVEHLTVDPGERVGLVGNNGAGKTTLLLLLLGLLRFQRGDVFLDGDTVRNFTLTWRGKTASYLGEGSLIQFLNPWEFWEFVGDAYGIERDEQRRRIHAYAGFVELATGKAARRKYLRDYSQGNRKKVGLVGAMMVRPKLLVLDEPFTSLDPRSRTQLELFLRDLNARYGTTLIVSSHDLVNVVDLSTRILLIEDGRIAHDGATGASTFQFIRGRLTSPTLKRAVSF